MAIRRILTIDNPADLAVLKQHSRPVAAVDADVRALMDDMLETMYAAPGIGLAAAQIGDLRRVVVMDLGDGEPVAGAADVEAPNTEGPVTDQAGEEVEAGRHANPRFFANPEIVWASDEMFAYEEGCLSLPDYYDEVERPARIRITYLDRDNTAVEEEIDGLYAVCFQHELDHLNGVLFIDHLSRLKRDRAVAKIKKSQRAKALEDA